MKITKLNIEEDKSLYENYKSIYNLKDEEINPTFKDLDDVYKIHHLKEIKEYIEKKERSNELDKILLVGDYDVDGVTSSSLYYLFMKEKYNIEVEVYIPEREKDGYGLQKHIVEYAKEKGFKGIITVDNGITAFEAVDYANEVGIDIIITDHHQIQKEVPNALYVLNPLTKESTFREKHLAGVGVIFCLLFAIDKDVAMKFLPLVALGTIADVMPMTNDNRIFVKKGLSLTPINKGLRYLYTLINEDAMIIRTKFLELNTMDIGFTLAPLINSAGRNNNARLAFDLLIEDDIEEIEKKLKAMKILNEKRKEKQKEFEEYILEKRELKEEVMGYMIEEREDYKFTGSIGGIIASKILNKTGKPTFILSLKENEDGKKYYSGSGRSDEQFDISIFISELKDKNLLLGGGGHSAAAGITIDFNKYDIVKKLFEESCKKNIKNINLDKEVFDIVKITDDKKEIKKKLSNLLKDFNKLEPFGNNFPRPLIAYEMKKIEELKTIGKDKLHVKIKSGGIQILFFNKKEKDVPKEKELFIANVQMNEFKNQDGITISYLQLIANS